MLSHDELIFLLQKKFPDTFHGKDYWVGHEIDPQTDKQAAPAFIVQWNIPGRDKPTAEDIDGWRESYKSEMILASKKATALEEISRAADVLKEENIDYRGVAYQADARAEKALIDRIAILQASGNTKAKTTWIAADNSQHDLSFADLAALAYAIAERKQQIVLRARTKKGRGSKGEDG